MAGLLIKKSHRLLPDFAHYRNIIQLCQQQIQCENDVFYQDTLYIPAVDGNITSVPRDLDLFDHLLDVFTENLNLCDRTA